jgi:F-type H+-transporting ATPase subunit delta
MPVRAASAARRYADAVFELAQSENRLDAWEHDLDLLGQVFGAPGVAEQLGNPSIAAAKKDSFIDQQIGAASQEARNLARLLVSRGRADLAGQILAAYREHLDEVRGIVHAQVTTAVELSEPERSAILERLRQMTGKQVTAEASVDPSIIGGIVVRIGDKLIDGSTRARLIQLKQRLAGAAR